MLRESQRAKDVNFISDRLEQFLVQAGTIHAL